ncbi:class I SAM-dependent methyltransferase [Parashewanella spongiae]|uniref:Class I SAM-dependent methyltransferase n=1 Tax=Parashewanella spongiae TaxID=342950 RepID=A0A3A6TEJ8_9GAMM|nr:class I SAM-dependent methyltransferase [Parashewanella spongiae]MCL1079827.1 class I SAM-dependent methyltransferase [Parashewanella spongiae]RJY06828.1 class I SAM-dependent methyltransferase [Parashewanella spongiae]
MSNQVCVLCHQELLTFYAKDKKRSYHQCQLCKLVQVESEYHLSAEDEKAEYDKHDNDVADAGYQKFLSRCLDPVLERVSPDSSGLDFGCGEGKVLSQMAASRGVHVANYDLYYVNELKALSRQYEFITLTEVIEHIYDVNQLLIQLKSLLKPNGLLAIMTKRVKDKQAFAQWHYKNDMTHICFYSIETFEWIANQFGWQLEVISDDVVILTVKCV